MYTRTWNSGKEKIKSLVYSLRCSEFELYIHIYFNTYDFIIIRVGIRAQY
ncbi:hypothetical protein Sjap_008557 [Stephania japonica]|uniref:Uncharacterized protein n=1 Tax=Stephania japonica TaxID=461633 RepID=A0AAP0PAZ7_9MAGN